MRTDSSAKAVLAFVGAAYALAIALSLVVGFTGGHKSSLIGLGYLSMFLPAVSVLIVGTTMHERLRVRWDRLPLRFLPVALFLIPGVLHAAIPHDAWSGISGSAHSLPSSDVARTQTARPAYE